MELIRRDPERKRELLEMGAWGTSALNREAVCRHGEERRRREGRFTEADHESSTWVSYVESDSEDEDADSDDRDIESEFVDSELPCENRDIIRVLVERTRQQSHAADYGCASSPRESQSSSSRVVAAPGGLYYFRFRDRVLAGSIHPP